jgi:hypothetical protein
MAIRDLWAFEDGPVGLNLAAAAANFANYTGHAAGTAGGAASGTITVTADGWLSVNSTDTVSSGVQGFSALKSTMGFTGSTSGLWCGFRIRSTTGALSASYTSIFSYGNTVLAGGSTLQTLLTAAQIVAAGGCTAANVSNYIEIFISSSVWQVWMDGKMILNGVPTYPGNTSNNWFLNWGCIGGSASNINFQIRDVYFLEVLTTGSDNGRLGPLQANAAPLNTVTGAEYVLNAGSSGATTLAQALGTALDSVPDVTPSLTTPADKTALTVVSGTPAATPAHPNILAVQLYASLAGSGSAAANIQAEVEVAEGNINVGTFNAPGPSMVWNQKLPFLRNNPTGGAWSSSDISSLTTVLTPQ